MSLRSVLFKMKRIPQIFNHLKKEKISQYDFFATKCTKMIDKGLNPGTPEITNYNGQIPNDNIQFSIKIKRQLFGILNFGHCDLFGICVLLFEIF